MHIDPRLATVLAVILIVAGAVIVITSGESVAVRFLTAIVTLDIAIRLYSRATGTTTPTEVGAVRARRPFGSPRRCWVGSSSAPIQRSSLHVGSSRWSTKLERGDVLLHLLGPRRAEEDARDRGRRQRERNREAGRRDADRPASAASAPAHDHAAGHPRVVQRAGGPAGGRIGVVLAREDPAEQHVRRDHRRPARRAARPAWPGSRPGARWATL